MSHPNGYKSFEDFTREALRPGMRAGWSIDELEMPNRRQDLDFDLDPFEASLREAEGERDEYE